VPVRREVPSETTPVTVSSTISPDVSSMRMYVISSAKEPSSAKPAEMAA
jgi:hypothetical protein